MVKVASARTGHLYGCLMDLPGEEDKNQAAGSWRKALLANLVCLGEGTKQDVCV